MVMKLVRECQLEDEVVCVGGDAYERKKENSDQGLKPRNFLSECEHLSKCTTQLDPQKGVQVFELVHNGCSWPRLSGR